MKHTVHDNARIFWLVTRFWLQLIRCLGQLLVHWNMVAMGFR